MNITDTLAVPDAVLPDYGDGGLLGLARRFARFVGGGEFVLPPGEMEQDEGAADAPRIVVFLLVDGLGDGFLQRYGQGSRLLAHRVGRLTSVFPSTTASAVTTLMTGLAPAEHGLTGWFVRDVRLGGVVAPLPMRVRGGEAIVGRGVTRKLFPYRKMFERARRPVVVLSPGSIAFSRYSRRHGQGARIVPYEGLDGLIEGIAAAVHTADATRGLFVHAYWPDFDALSHACGSTSDQVVALFGRLDEAFAALTSRLAGSAAEVVVSADHGFVDSPPERQLALAQCPDLGDLLVSPLFGERRVAFCEVASGQHERFEALASAWLGGRGTVLRSDELVAAGWLGQGGHHPRLRERVGSHAIVMAPGWTLMDTMPGEQAHTMLGVHGGASADEMWVPLIRMRC